MRIVVLRWLRTSPACTLAGIFTVALAQPQAYAQQPLTPMRSYNSGTAMPKLVLHPNTDDFAAGKVGRILISKQRADVYHTTVPTTIANTVAQTQDAKVKITAHIVSASAGAGRTVYFRQVEPDPDDQSSYETDNIGGDNVDGHGALSADRAVAVATTINGSLVAAAEVELTITGHCSGDNYLVEASLDPTFASGVSQTCILVAWKRVYLEYDQMYKYGATITTAHVPDADNPIPEDDVLHVDNALDFQNQVNKPVIIIRRGLPDLPTTLRAVDLNAKTITVLDENAAIPKYSGVRTENDDVYEVGLNLLQSAYGGDTAGTDGGAFVEFVYPIEGSGKIPKYTSFPVQGAESVFDEAFNFCAHWFNNSANNGGNQYNVIQLIAAKKHDESIHGVSHNIKNISLIVVENFTPASYSGSSLFDAVAEVVVHEIGHQFGAMQGSNNHVDLPDVDAPNHDGSDNCVMSYSSTQMIGGNGRVLGDGEAEFDWLNENSCIKIVRDAVDPR